MKKKFILLPLLGAFFYVTLSSDSNGPGGNKSGSHGASASCGTCHGSSATSGITVTFELDSAGIPVTRYVGGMTYTLKMIGTNTTSNTLPKFGMQMSVVSGSGSSSVNAGTFTSFPTNTDTSRVASINILEHRAKLDPSSGTGGSGTLYTVTTTWTAPPTGSGTVTAYGIINAVNNNGNDGSTDKWNSASSSFTELVPTSINTISEGNVMVYPNPARDVIYINGSSVSAKVFDLNGNMVASGNNQISISNLASGMYVVSYQIDGQLYNATFIKQ